MARHNQSAGFRRTLQKSLPGRYRVFRFNAEGGIPFGAVDLNGAVKDIGLHILMIQALQDKLYFSFLGPLKIKMGTTVLTL